MVSDETVQQIKQSGKAMATILGLTIFPVGVRFLREGTDYPEGAEVLKQHRYCQALMRARRGEHVVLPGDNVACPAAAAAFGFRPLPEGLKSGKGLVGFGIVSNKEVGRIMFSRMPRLKPNSISGLYLYPLDEAEVLPDVVVVEGEVEKLMWIVLSYLHAKGGERVLSTTAVLQATCVDSTIIPYIDQRLNFGYGCYGCRDATDLGPGEAVLGFPVSDLPAIVEHLEFLSKKAIPVSRGKKAFSLLIKKE